MLGSHRCLLLVNNGQLDGRIGDGVGRGARTRRRRRCRFPISVAECDSPACTFAGFSSKWRKRFLIFVADPRTVRLYNIGLIHPPAAHYSTEATAVLVFSGVPSFAGEVDTAAERQRVIDDRDFL